VTNVRSDAGNGYIFHEIAAGSLAAHDSDPVLKKDKVSVTTALPDNIVAQGSSQSNRASEGIGTASGADPTHGASLSNPLHEAHVCEFAF
jgi:hypothetical protein